MDRPEVGEGVDVSGGVVDGAGRVDGLGDVVGVDLDALVLQDVAAVASFVPRRPGDDRRVVAVALDDLDPLG